MSISHFTSFLSGILGFFGYFIAVYRIRYQTSPSRKSVSQLKYYGYITFLYTTLAAVVGLLVAYYAEGAASHKLIKYLPINLSFITLILCIFSLNRSFNAQFHLEKWFKIFILSISSISILGVIATIGIILNYSLQFFAKVNFFDFLFGLTWNPTMADKDLSHAFGIMPLLFGTFYISAIAIGFAAPIAINAAIYLSEYSGKKVRNLLKPAVEMLAAIPSIVYGYLGLIYISPVIKIIGETIHLSATTENTLSTGLLIGMMMIPMIMSLSDDVIRSIPKDLRFSALALGLTKHETIKNVIIPAAKPGILAVIILAISRAVGETMIVIMCAGLNSEIKVNPFQAVSTFTAQITNLLIGDDAFDSPKTLSAFALALILIIFTMTLNLIANKIVKHYKEKYGYNF
ncbi:phosphate ABC transporter permease subunit PstC [Rickettsiales endosymbiont of Stachyamoeba lipophora]|uniref:phosphate ABC transporter permease subunit PstC n=1 Tax=Rickettsiales endosymbiont of Stachyamoeba lipophora TaxID=2486578 RepID=UPI000F651E87|nr:phosphate ABC transporter permease subunit PstC [Rickettsiales endosymbiont of Stachyamoeba lipophora]AZL15114.1 phosphate ABC transporter permease subunit PstC [Rickettsiales endosymbiont of Stachyamoeba lipophora]